VVVKIPGKQQQKKKSAGADDVDGDKDEVELKWDQHHPARKLLIGEIDAGRIPLDSDVMGPAEVFFNYMGTLEFQIKGMDYGDKFVARLRRLREMVEKDKDRAARDLKALKNALKLHPPAPLNHRGQPQWNGSVAQALLQYDMSRGKHKERDPSLLRMDRPEYQAATSMDQFRWHVHQETRTQKYLYTLEYEADQKLKKNLEKSLKTKA